MSDFANHIALSVFEHRDEWDEKPPLEGVKRLTHRTTKVTVTISEVAGRGAIPSGPTLSRDESRNLYLAWQGWDPRDDRTIAERRWDETTKADESVREAAAATEPAV